MKKQNGAIIFSPTDLIRYFESPFASWMDRYHLENPGAVTPDEESEDQKLIAETGDQHEQSALHELRKSTPGLVEIPKDEFGAARAATLSAVHAGAPIIFQAALADGPFAGYADFLILGAEGQYQVWDTKLARAPKPYYAIQLCCYSEMLAAVAGQSMPEKFGIILGTTERVEFRVEDFIHYYGRIKAGFLAMHAAFGRKIEGRPEPLPRADHGRWNSHAERFFADTDHLVQVAGISVGQIKKLKAAGVATVAALAAASGKVIRKLGRDSLEKLAAQARLQCQTRDERSRTPDVAPKFEVLPHAGPNGELVGLAELPPANPSDVFFDMEGYPLVDGGLEYLFGACSRTPKTGSLNFKDWWGHNREQEKSAFEGFVDWVFERWSSNPGTRKRWNHLLTLMRQRWEQMCGMRVFEMHEFHGLHVHLVTNRFLDVNEARAMAQQAGWGRIDVKRIPIERAAYLAKYLSKERPPCLKGWRLWAGFGEWEWTRIKDLITQSRIATIYRACKEWLGWTGRKGFFDRMRFVAWLEFRSAVEGWIDGCGPGGKPYWMCCREELMEGSTVEVPF